jgi:hypothetical protein
MATTPGGDLIVGGNFYSVGDVPARSIARWNGLQWSALGTTVYRAFSTVLALPDGDIVATGGFVSSGPLGANFIARWDGTAWHPYGGGVNQAPGALALLPGGDLAVGGGFTVYDDLSIRYLARWSTRPACPGDFDCSGGRPDYHDILEFLDAWFAREPRADINASGAFTVQDVLDFLAAFFATCD